MTAVGIPAQRGRHDARHWCHECEECPSCEGGARRLPIAWSVDVRDDGHVIAVCAVCHNSRTVCPTTTRTADQEAPL